MIDAPVQPVRVWDLPTRVFHWVLAATIVGSLVSGKIGGAAAVWHFRFGYVVFALLLFRLVWGFVGGRWSRFASFFYSPLTILRYLRGRSRADEHHEVGHNPLGSLSVFALLAFLTLQVATGLVADDEIANTGPLNRFVASAVALKATAWHKHIGQWVLIVLVLTHVAAILYYLRVKKTNLLRPMLLGDKPLPRGVPASHDTAVTRVLALMFAAVCAAVVTIVVGLGTP